MAIVECKECGKEISSEAKACPGCGAPLPREGMGVLAKVFLSLGGVLALFLAIGALTGPSNDQKTKDRAVLATCWEMQAKKSLDPGAARFAAGACERLEDEFQAKYGVRP